jgi:hypothetical protein
VSRSVAFLVVLLPLALGAGAAAVVTDDTARDRIETYIHTFIDTDDFEGSRTCSAPVYRATNGVLVALQVVEKGDREIDSRANRESRESPGSR